MTIAKKVVCSLTPLNTARRLSSCTDALNHSHFGIRARMKHLGRKADIDSRTFDVAF